MNHLKFIFNEFIPFIIEETTKLKEQQNLINSKLKMEDK